MKCINYFAFITALGISKIPRETRSQFDPVLDTQYICWLFHGHFSGMRAIKYACKINKKALKRHSCHTQRMKLYLQYPHQPMDPKALKVCLAYRKVSV